MGSGEWVRIPFAAIFADIPEADLSLWRLVFYLNKQIDNDLS